MLPSLITLGVKAGKFIKDYKDPLQKVGSFLSTGIGIGRSVMGLFGSKDNAAKAAKRQYEYQRLLNQQSFDLTQKGYRVGPKNQRYGLESAGYNPMLPFISGGQMSLGSYSGGSASAPMDSTTADLGNMATNAYKVFKLAKDKNTAEISQILAGVKNTNADTALKESYAMTEEAKRTQMDFQNAMLDVERHLADKKLKWSDRQFYADIYDKMQRAENYSAMTAIHRYNAETNRMLQETNADINAENIARAKSDVQFRNEHPKQTALLDFVRRYSDVVDNVEKGSRIYKNLRPPVNTSEELTYNIDNDGFVHNRKKKIKRKK